MRVSQEVTHDAVVIVPGIMGSALRDENGLVWGLSPSWFAKAWCADGPMRTLQLTADERAGRYGRIAPHGLLRMPAYAPGLGGFEPYTNLRKAVREVVAHDDAVLEFAYDWRLPVDHNARLLAVSARAHLAAWRAHEACRTLVRTRGDERPARLVFVAHSMGGLLVRALALPDVDGALADDIRAVVTVGTPFRGAAKAVLLLNTGTGAPLPRRRLRDLARTLPGLYDLLPTYRCVDLGDDVAALSPSDVEGLGGDEELAQQSADLHTRLRQVTIPGHRQVVGLGQTTPSSLVVDGGVYHARSYSFDVHGDGSLVRDEQGVLRRIERHGDGTVPRNSAELIRGTGSPPQQHGALARTREVLRAVRGVLTESEYGGELGDGLLGLDVPDLVQAGAAWTITVTNPRRPTCVIVDTEADREVARLPIGRRDGVYQADGPNLAPGLYRIQVHSDGSSPVSQIVLIFDP